MLMYLKSFFRVFFILIILGFATSCAKSGSPADTPSDNTLPPDTTGTGTTPLPVGTGKIAAMRALPTPSEKVAAMESILANAGIRTGDIDAVYTEAVGNAARGFISKYEVIKLAQDFDKESMPAQMTFEYVAAFLGDAGIYSIKPDFSSSDLLLFMQDWLTIARAAPSEVLHTNILIVDEINQLRTPSINLLSPDVTPDILVMSSLEVELLVAAIERLYVEVLPQQSKVINAESSVEKVEPRCKPGIGLIRQPAKVRGLAIPAPCSDLKSQFGKDVENIAGAGYDYIGPAGFGEILKNRLGVSEGAADKVGKALDAAKLLKLAHRLYMIYKYVEIDLEPEGSSEVHKPVEGKEEKKKIIANVKIPDEVWLEYKAAVAEAGLSGKISAATQNCLKEAGFPTTNDLSDLAGVMENWRVDWDIVRGAACGSDITKLGGPNCHVYISQDSNEFIAANTKYETRLTKEQENSAKSHLVVDLTTEPVSAHPNGKKKRATVLVKGELLTAEPPSLSTFTGAAQGGLNLANSIAELVGGFIQTVAPPKAYQTLYVSYHLADLWDGTITVTVKGSKHESSTVGGVSEMFAATINETYTYGVNDKLAATADADIRTGVMTSLQYSGMAGQEIPVTIFIPFVLSGEAREDYRYSFSSPYGEECGQPFGPTNRQYSHRLYDALSSDRNEEMNQFFIMLNPVTKTYEITIQDFLTHVDFTGNAKYLFTDETLAIDESGGSLITSTPEKTSGARFMNDPLTGTFTSVDKLEFSGTKTLEAEAYVYAIRGEQGSLSGQMYGVQDSDYAPSLTVPLTVTVTWNLSKEIAK